MMKKSAQRIQVWLIFAMVLVLGCIPLVAHAAVITCPAGYQCMAETAAAAQWGQGQYVKYSSGVCGTDIDMTVYYYCFKQKPVTTTITTTPVTTIPQVSCPAGSECMLDSKAKSTWGQGNYEPYSSAVCGTGPVSSPYGGMEFCYGPKRVTNAPIPVKSLITPSGSVQVCAHIPCEPPKVLYCPDKCPGGCGVVCVIPKELPKPPSPETSFVFSGIVDEWRFDTGQDMSREAPRYMQRVSCSTVPTTLPGMMSATTLPPAPPPITANIRLPLAPTCRNEIIPIISCHPTGRSTADHGYGLMQKRWVAILSPEDMAK